MSEQEPLPKLDQDIPRVQPTGYAKKYGEVALPGEVSLDYSYPYPPEYDVSE